jgi:uncharacterized membrane protein YcaP (DUF421 family)
LTDMPALMLDNLTFFFRAVFIYFITLIVVRTMGKRSIGELSAFDFVLMASLGDIMGTAALDKNISIWNGIIVLITVAALETVLSLIGIKNRKMAKLIEGTPTLLIKDGNILRENMKKEKFSLLDLKQELRKKGVKDRSQVKKAYLEACGEFTVLLKNEEEPVCRKDIPRLVNENCKSLEQKFQEITVELQNIHNKLESLTQTMDTNKDNGGNN